ncbi:hypothetical protein PGH07_05300 [Sulfurovum sp. zt1-1]|uniref:Porin domain-containing protein n=1 Tax=Sulfurovum zhangzhouensis TaxID=3019067 RepID=A0ABT7QXM3_9BACT|nr:hypothetical protein [Sulfurovum zhangzhouensis]MDM5271583.1 hypothetical protein [Sulfurovum zhangzhouensis]
MKHPILTYSLFFISSLFASDAKYQLGQGLQLGDLPLYLGGYTSLEYSRPSEGNRVLKLEELALMLYGEQDRFSYMIEMEAEDVYTEVFGNEAMEEQHQRFHIERLYFNYDFDENYAIKAGKYNSPIGFWNKNPINVLRDTTSSPIIVERLFPEYTTGLEFTYQTQNENMLTINTMFQHSEDLDKTINDDIYNNFEIDQHFGLGVSFQNDDITYQFNTGYFQMLTGTSYNYLLGSFNTNLSNEKIQGELGTQWKDGKNTLSYIGYLQWIHTLTEQHETILRVESYKDNEQSSKDTFLVFGYTYRPYFPVALKAEYQWHSFNEKNQMLLSLSILF